MAIDQASYLAVQPELLSGETLLWAAQPNPAAILGREDLFLIPFSLLWGGFAIFWEAGVLGLWGLGGTSKGPWVFGAIWGVPFVLVGQYFIWGRFLVARWMKQRTYYAVTNKRVMAVQDGLRRKMVSLYIDTLPALAIDGERNGRGTLRFTQSQPYWYQGRSMNSWNTMALGDTPVFRDVDDVDSVYRLVSQQRESLRPMAHS